MRQSIWVMVFILGIPSCAATAQEAEEELAATLPDGTSIELVGLRNYSILDLEKFKEKDSPWWRPDGTALVEPPDRFNGRTSSRASYWFVIRVGGGKNHDFKAVGPYGSDLTVQPVRQKAQGFEKDDLRHFSLRFSPNQEQGDIELGVATGDWKVADRWSIRPGWTPYDVILGSSEQIVLRCPEQRGSDVVAEVTQVVTERATRLVVLDRDGNQHVSPGKIGGEGVGLVRHIHRFENLDISSVERIEFQVKPYNYWITFSNVSLHIGHKTQVKLDVSQPGALLEGDALPGFDDIELDFSAEDYKGRMLLICFFDMNQRPSRRYINELATRAGQLKEKRRVAVIAVQASKIGQDSLDEWTRQNGIPFPVGMIKSDMEKTRFTWGVESLPWLILTDSEHVVSNAGFGLSELDEKIKATN